MGRATRAAAAVADVAVAALREEPGPLAMRRVTDRLLDLVGADHVLYHEFERRGHGGIHGTAPAAAWDALPLHGGPTDLIRRLHPGVDHVARHAPSGAFTITDLLAERQWRGTELVSLMRPFWGRTLKLHLAVRGDDDRVLSGWAFTRDGRDYTNADREVALAVLPVLEVVARQYQRSRAAGLARAGATPETSRAGLTRQEQRVLALVATGVTAAAAARRLGISPRTAGKHLERAYRALGVHDRVSAVLRAGELGLLRDGGADPQPRAPAGAAPLF